MSASRIRSARDRAVTSQHGLCHYCGLPMLAPQSSLSKQLREFVPSAEHLIARCDGGGNGAANIVAAHVVCNRRRHQRAHPRTAIEFKALVSARIAAGRWHPSSVLKGLGQLP